ncbi:type II toxin-antitoxin system RelE/ParE family toxin [Roseibium sp.]|uniref:type II toxin-antitoxin system RelE/ParE family toxin n=1 Tax=Roseibium sp. TaxID=1936156 RepID=UPI003A980070
MFVYLASEGEEAAIQFVNELSSKLEWIAESGFSGVARDWIRPGLRAVIYRERCIYYRINDDAVTILRIVHERQDVSAQEF